MQHLSSPGKKTVPTLSDLILRVKLVLTCRKAALWGVLRAAVVMQRVEQGS